MSHFDLLKRAFNITWRYRPLWLFGFILALCGGGGGSSGGNFNLPGGDNLGDFGNAPNVPEIEPDLIFAIIVGVILLVILLTVVSIMAQVVARTALIGMVSQIQATDAVTISAGWRWGWSGKGWRLFLVNLLIGIPLTVLAIFLVLLALSPLLLLMAENSALTVVSIVLSILAVLFVILVLVAVKVVINPFQELAWRRTVLADQQVIASLREAVGLVKQRFKDVAVIWLLMIGIGFGWGILAVFVVLPVSLLAALVLGGIPAGLVYLISRSGIGAAIAGVPLALLTLIMVSSVATGFYLVYQSSIWTLTYLEIRKDENQETSDEPSSLEPQVLPPGPQSEV